MLLCYSLEFVGIYLYLTPKLNIFRELFKNRRNEIQLFLIEY